MPPKSRNVGLDVCRAAAILGVLCCHEIDLTIHGFHLFEAFGSGVELFFVLSGFLIGRIYFRAQQKKPFSFWSFWRSRWWRTLPPYWATILLYLGIERLHRMPPIHWYYGLFLQNYLGVAGFGPSWSLCVEEHFYLLLPVAGFCIFRLAGKRAWPYVIPAAFIVPLIWRLAMLARPLPSQWYWFSNLHCDGLIAGIWLAYAYVEKPELWRRLKRPALWLLPLSPIVVFTLPVWSGRSQVADMLVNTLFAVGYAAWLRYLYDLEWSPGSAVTRTLRSAVVGIALCSYSVYLTHTIVDPPIRSWIAGELHRGILRTGMVMALTFLFGVIFYFIIERPTIRTRDRYLKRRTPSKFHAGSELQQGSSLAAHNR